MTDDLDPTLPVEPPAGGADAGEPAAPTEVDAVVAAAPAAEAEAAAAQVSMDEAAAAQVSMDEAAQPVADAALPADPALPADAVMPADPVLDAAAIATAPAPTAEELAALVAATEAAMPIGLADQAADADAEQAAAEAAGAKHKRRHFGLGVIILRLASLAFTLLLLVGGGAIGAAIFQRTQPPPILVGDVSTGGIDAPPVVKELTDALTTNNADSIRSAVSTGPYEKLAAELQQWNIQGVTSVETLATMKDGPRTATEIIIRAKTADGNPLIINLVVHVADNKIVNFR
jgi:hypothetical protein